MNFKMRRINRDFIKLQFIQIFAITEKNLKLRLRFKYQIIISFIRPIISILMPLIILGQFFELNAEFGSWNENTYLVFQFIAYQIFLIKNLVNEFPTQIVREKYWKTIQSLIIAPLNRYNLLLGIFLPHMILISIPMVVFFIICYIVYPISLLTVLSVILIFFLIALIFSAIGLFLGVFAITNENIWKILGFILNFIILLSCITYPYEIFPSFIQQIINLNPLYYLFDLLRFVWIEDHLLISILTHPIDIMILFTLAIALPLISVYIFNTVYQKYGIVGY